jgi:hypothetical protein
MRINKIKTNCAFTLNNFVFNYFCSNPWAKNDLDILLENPRKSLIDVSLKRSVLSKSCEFSSKTNYLETKLKLN